MCWNEEVSLNTFMFSMGTLGFVLYNNHYTQYKINFFDNIYVIFFVFLVISVQLIEYFLWKSLKTKNISMNRTWSIIGYIVILLQPIITLMWVSNNNIRNTLLALYIAIYGLAAIVNPIQFEAIKHKSGHLQWLFTHHDKDFTFKGVLNFLATCIWSISFFTGFYYLVDFPCFVVITLLTLSMLLYYIYSGKTEIFNSNWCWLSNGMALAIAFFILFVLPYREYQTIC